MDINKNIFMQRDGALTSIWQYKMPDYVSQTHNFNKDFMMY